jgi:uncharacterized protein YciI
MKFVNFATYRDLDRIAASRPAHFAYADRLREDGKLAVGGPLMDDSGQRVGLLFLYEAASRDEALALVRDDPFTLADGLSSYEVTGLRLRGVNAGLLVAASRGGHQGGGENLRTRLFAIHAKYTADHARLAAVRPAHWAYDRALKSSGQLALAGPFVDDRGADDMGGLFVYGAASREEAASHLRQDPFALGGVFETCRLFEWRIEGVNPALLTVDLPRQENAVSEAELDIETMGE